MKLSCAISPCPNDTFLFYGWIKNLIDHPLELDVSFFDIESLNELGFTNSFSLIKLSCFTLGKLKAYQPLPIGAALGFHQGPKLIAKKNFPLKDLEKMTVAIPGKGTTAHLLFQDLLPIPKKKIFCLYHEVFDLLDEVDAAIVIHESRFTFEKRGFYELADLGTLFSQKYHLPLALGALALKNGEGSKKELIIAGLRKSLIYAKNHPEDALKFVLEHSQEKDLSIINQHISLYVNNETEKLSWQGIKAIEKIFELGRKYETPALCPS